MTGIQTRIVENGDAELIMLWDKKVKEKSLPPQACYQWKTIIEDIFKAKAYAFLAMDENGKTVGFALVFFKAGEEILYSCRYGFYADNQDVSLALQGEVQKLAYQYGIHKTVMTSGNHEFDLSEQQENKESLYLPLTYQDEEALWLSLPKKTKNMIRKAEKTGITVLHDWDKLDQFYDIYTERFTEKSLGIKPFGLFQSIRDLFGEDAVLMCAVQDNQLAAGMIFISAGDTVSYGYNASNLDASNSGANNLLMWEAMRYFHGKGAKYIDLSESKPDSPVYKFKMRLSKDIEARAIYYYDFMDGVQEMKEKPMSVSLFVKYKIRGLLQRLMPVMPHGLKKKYLQYLGMGGRLI